MFVILVFHKNGLTEIVHPLKISENTAFNGLELTTANIWINMILYDFCLLPAQFSDEIINVRNVESHMQFADLCAPWKMSNGAENLVLQALQFQ
jgi:hypothetical protein